MDELIQQLTSKLGIDASVAGDATNKAMAMVKEHAGDDLFGKISAAIPGASEAATQGAAEPEEAGQADEGGGMLGKLAGMASSALGGSTGSGLELGAALSSAGLDTEQLGGFISTVVEFLKDKVGDEVMEQVLAKFPVLKSLLG
jgi:hypothetical protein